MTFRTWQVGQLVAACAGLALLSAGCGLMAPKAEQYVAPPAGTTWVQMRRDTGSFGSGSAQVQFKFLGPQTWNGQELFAFESEGVTTLITPRTGNWVTMVRGGKPFLSWEPAAGWEWPLEVGKKWTRKTVMTVHAQNRQVPYEYTTIVEAHEEITVPAGRFKTFKLRTVDTLGSENTFWYVPELSVFGRQSLKRGAKHPQGAGTREVELVSHSAAK